MASVGVGETAREVSVASMRHDTVQEVTVDLEETVETLAMARTALVRV